PGAPRPDRLPEPGAPVDRRAGGCRGDGRDVGRGPALPRSCAAHRFPAGGRPRPPAHHSGGAQPGRGRRRHVEGENTVAPRDQRATLANVAASAGVSVATVSKVLNGRDDVAPATRALVQDLLHEHDYVARRVRPAHAPTIELFFQGQLNAYHTEVLQGVVEAGAEAGVAVVVRVRPRGQRGAGAKRPVTCARDLAAAGRQAAIVVTSELTGVGL